MDKIREISAQLDSVTQYIDLAHREAKLGNIVKLNDLHDNVANICAAIAELPVSDVMHFIENLNEVSNKLNDLEVELRAQKIEVEREIKNANNNKIAATAYEKAQTTRKNLENKNDN